MVFQAHSGIDVEKSVADTQFRIATNSKLFSILSDSIYTRKIDAVIRELCCNAFDAHAEAKQTRKFQVTLPSELNSEFRVRDFGRGLCEEDMQMYTTYGESTKSGSNAYIGAFGIGAKSPFAYTNIFNVISYHGGMARAYSMFVENGVPKMTVLGERPSDEPSGLEVFFPVADKDINEFQEKAAGICALMADNIEFLQARDSWISEFELEVAKYRWEPAGYLGQGYMSCELAVDTSASHDYLYIVQGNVKYEMDLQEVLSMLKYALGKEYCAVSDRIRTAFYISGFLRVPNGTFVPHPSRERLSFDDLTKEALKRIFEKIYKYYITDPLDRILDGVKSYYDLHCRIQNTSKIVSSSERIVNFSIDSQNIAEDRQTIGNYREWRKFEFACVQITGGVGNVYRLVRNPQMIMYGENIDRIYYTDRYPLPGDCRYRVLEDKIQSGAKNAIILCGDIGSVFTGDDKAGFIDVQTLPKLDRAGLLAFKNKLNSQSGSEFRVTRETVSFLLVMRYSDSGARCNLGQTQVDSIAGKAAEYPVYWTGSNRRYEFTLGGRLFHLKTQGDLDELNRGYFDFFVDYIGRNDPSGNKKLLKFGVAVLPENCGLREKLPELETSLRDGVCFEAKYFLDTTFYEIHNFIGDFFLEKFIKNQELILKMFAGNENSDYWAFFKEWFSAGMPEPGIVKRKRLPFQLLGSNETSLKDDYYSKRNIRYLDVNEMFGYLAGHGFPLFEGIKLYCLSDTRIVEDLVVYAAKKCDLLHEAGN
jgi:hypothetical protein